MEVDFIPVAFDVTGPRVEQNLAVYLIRGKSKLPAVPFKTLREGMEDGSVRVYETCNVNRLAIQNLSREAHLFIQAGDIVKGGRQDRVLAYDLLLPPRSGRVPLGAFCVESGRWSRRGAEASGAFSSSELQLVTKELKIAAKYQRDQGHVWSEVGRAQQRLSEAVGEQVAAAESRSSLQLALENKRVRAFVLDYIASLSDCAEEEEVIGVAFAINGRLNSAEIYASNALLRKLWPKVLRAIAIEALTRRSAYNGTRPPGKDEVAEWLAMDKWDRATESGGSGKVRSITFQGERDLLFESRTGPRPEDWIHRSHLRR